MTDFLQYEFKDSPEAVATFDELPLWSAPFGLLLLEHVTLKPGLTVLDAGCGAGFPLLELAQRLGPSSKCYGLDPWQNAAERVKQKIINYGVKNVEMHIGSASDMPFEQNTFDLIVSNLGVNNFDDAEKVFGECYRVLKPGGALAVTTNLNGHWQEFYTLFENTLRELNRADLIPGLIADREHRGTIASVSQQFTNAGFTIDKITEAPFTMRFADGTAFLNHYFIKLGWLSSWKSFIPEADRIPVFSKLEENLNVYAGEHNGLTLTVPAAFIQGVR